MPFLGVGFLVKPQDDLGVETAFEIVETVSSLRISLHRLMSRVCIVMWSNDNDNLWTESN